MGALFALTWFPAGFFIASGVVDGALMWPAELDAWLALATLVPGGLPLALACGALWRRGHGVAALMVLALVPAIAAGSLVVALFGPIALVAFARGGEPAGLAALRLYAPLPAVAATGAPAALKPRAGAHRLPRTGPPRSGGHRLRTREQCAERDGSVGRGGERE